MSNNPNKDYTQLHIRASEHPKSICSTYSDPEYCYECAWCNYWSGIDRAYRCSAQHLNCRSAVCDHYIAYSHCNPEKVSEYSLPESDSDLHLRSNLFSSKLLPSSHWCSGYYGKNGSDVPDADRFFFWQPLLMPQFFIKPLTAKCFRQKGHGLRA